MWNDEFIVGELGQVGTQFDGPFHVGIRGPDSVDRWYNGRALNSMENVYGSTKHNGVERLGPIVTRGVLIDVAGLKGVDSMQLAEVITLADVENCIKKAGIAPIGEGDMVIFRTGWVGKYWKDAKTFVSGTPGIGMEVAQYLIKKNVGMTGMDSWPHRVHPLRGSQGGLLHPQSVGDRQRHLEHREPEQRYPGADGQRWGL